jgi:D-beta-D-heptose 7-phosphate kinase/D-beta-D-heptose 1-phosphate adenosyltransferase
MIISAQTFHGRRILVVGDIMLDRYIIGDVNRISPEAPVPVLAVKERKNILGGAANVASNLAGLGCDVSLWGVAGEDNNAEVLACLLRKRNIQNRIVTTSLRPTSTKTRITAGNHQIVRYDEEVTDQLPSSIEEKLFCSLSEEIEASHAVILSDYAKGVLQGELCSRIINECVSKGKPVFVDPKGHDWNRYRGATCITPNEAELALISDNPRKSGVSIAANARNARARFSLRQLLVTLGANGMALFLENEEECVIPASRVREVFDVSGAGDTVVAVLAASIAAGATWKDAAKLANQAAGIVVTRAGTSPITIEDMVSLNSCEEKGKTLSLEEASLTVESWKKNGESVVFTNGCFDLLHPGHVRLLQEASKEGDRLVVGLNSDASVKMLKGAERPVLGQEDRAAILSALDCVDMVILFEEETPLNIIRALHPSVLVKGGDYSPDSVVGKEIVEADRGRVVIIPLLEGKSTTGILHAIRR